MRKYGSVSGKRMRYWGQMSGMLLVVCLLVATLTGCSGRDVDYDLDTEQNANGSTGGLEQFADAEDWKDTVEYTDAEGRKIVATIDAGISTPDVDAMYVVKAEETVCDTAFKTQIMDSFFEGGDIYYHDIPYWTREELEEAMSDVERSIQEQEENLEGFAGMTDMPDLQIYLEGMQSDLDRLNALLQQYRDAYEEAGDEYTPAEEVDSCNNFIGYRDGIKYIVSFPAEGEDPYISIMAGEMTGGASTYIPEGLEKYSNVTCYWQDLEEGTNQCSISREDAQALADQLLRDCGRSCQVLTQVYDLEWRGFDPTSEDDIEEYVRDGYSFAYGTGVDEIAFSSFGAQYNYRGLTDGDAGDGGYDLSEYTCVYVSGAGVIGIQMNAPVTVTNISVPVGLLPLATIQDIMKNEIAEHSDLYSYEDWIDSAYRSFNALELIYFRVKSDDTPGEYSYVPVWRLSREKEEYEERYYKNPIMVNAIDGSVIYLEDELKGWNTDQ